MYTREQLGIFAWNINLIRSISEHSSSKSEISAFDNCLFFKTFLLLFLLDILPNDSFATCETEHDYYQEKL